jgi:cell division transport system permease protein
LTFVYYYKEFLRYLKTAKTAAISSTIVVALAVLLLGVYLTISVNSVKLMKTIRDRVEIDAYLVDEFKDSEVSSLSEKIKTIGGVKQVKFISKDEAAKIFAEDFGQDILEVFDYNPLPASLKISLYDEYKTLDRLEKINTELQKFSEIGDIDYAKKNLEILERNAQSLLFLNITLLVIITFSSIFLVGNTIRLMIEAKKDNIETMKLIGAAKETIRTPFIMEGFFQGFIGSLIAVFVLQGFLSYFFNTYSSNDFNFDVIDIKFLILLVIFGTILGTFGSAISIRRYLKFA